MRRALVAALAVLVLVLGACASNGSSSSSSSSSNGSSSSNSDGSSGDALTSDGSSRNDGSSNNGGSSGGSSNTSTPAPTNTGTVPPSASAPPPPSGFTLPQPDANGNVRVPDQPPPQVRDESPRQRLRDLPPVPRSCLDDDLTLLDVFVPALAIPVRLMYCLLYIGTIPRLASEAHITVTTPSLNGPDINVFLVAPGHTQRALATLALIILLIVVAILVGYAIGRRQRALR